MNWKQKEAVRRLLRDCGFLHRDEVRAIVARVEFERRPKQFVRRRP